MTTRCIDSERHIRDLEFLSDVTREMLSSLELETLLRRVVQLVRSRFGYDYAAVGLVEDGMVVFRAGSGGHLDGFFDEEQRPPAWRLAVGQGIVGTAVWARAAHLVNDVTSDPDYIRVEYLSQTRSELAVPLVHLGDALGVLDVQSHLANAFDESDVRLLEIVAALVAPAVHAARLFELERRKSRQLHLAGEISRLVMSSLDREQVTSMACEAILEALDISFAGVALIEGNALHIVRIGYASRLPLLPGAPSAVEMGQGLVGWVVATGEPLRIPDVSAYPEFIPIVPGVCSALCIPLRVRDRVIGAVDLEHDQLDRFTEEDEELLQSVSVYLAQAMENAYLFEDQRRRWQQLLVINEATRIATESFDLDEILSQVAREVHDRFGYFAVAVMLFDERDVVIRALHCDEPLALAVGCREPLGGGLAGRVVQSGAAVIAACREQIPVVSALREDIESILCVPLCTASGVIGALQVQSLRRDAFGDEDRLAVETLARSVAGAIANARAIRQTEKFREDLNRMIVHDLRNPVQAVLLTLQEVQRAAEGRLAETVHDAVGEGMSCAEDILEMVNSLLDVARFEAGRAQVRLAPAVLNDHVRAVIKRFAPLARSKRIQVTTVLSPDVPVVRIDHELVGRTLANLVGNAMKFTPEGARVTVLTELAAKPGPGIESGSPCVLVSVQDTGEGIPLEYHKKIFEKFGQVESRKAGLKMSTGLGLALCRYVVEAHGGRIWVESVPGKGATFRFTLPVHPRPNVEPPSEI